MILPQGYELDEEAKKDCEEFGYDHIMVKHNDNVRQDMQLAEIVFKNGNWYIKTPGGKQQGFLNQSKWGVKVLLKNADQIKQRKNSDWISLHDNVIFGFADYQMYPYHMVNRNSMYPFKKFPGPYSAQTHDEAQNSLSMGGNQSMSLRNSKYDSLSFKKVSFRNGQIKGKIPHDQLKKSYRPPFKGNNFGKNKKK